MLSLQAQLLIIILIIGIVVGGIAALSAKGKGLVVYIVVGVLGSLLGQPGLVALGIHLGIGEISVIVNAILGAVFLVIVARVFFKLFGKG